MTKKLKTLKQLNTLKGLRKRNAGIGTYSSVIDDDGQELENDEEYVQKEKDLRTEAIKWVKWMRGLTPDSVMDEVRFTGEARFFLKMSPEEIRREEVHLAVERVRELRSGERWIMHFFNLKEEDLR